jgi:hypothetical protein
LAPWPSSRSPRARGTPTRPRGASTWRGKPPLPHRSDPSVQSCAALDSLGYCPGDDPSPLQQWCAGDGYSNYQAVQSDLTQMQTDAGNGDLGSVMSDGRSLGQDATNAFEHLPPGTSIQKVDYGAYIGSLVLAGDKESLGDINGATTLLQKAWQFTDTVNNLTDQCSS